MVSTVIDKLAAGVSNSDILRSNGALTEQGVDEALAYAAELTREGPSICLRKLAFEVQG